MSEHHVVLNAEGYPEIKGMRYNGYRWVAEDSFDTTRAIVAPPAAPGRDMFGGTGERKPPRLKPAKRKTRRRGGFGD